uniref:Prostaglandin F2 receptor negative regulator-like n=1 Tax=Sinocyclocheilus rhinocerous TaxID=307959 RepID=A0A673GS83_9TELE
MCLTELKLLCLVSIYCLPDKSSLLLSVSFCEARVVKVPVGPLVHVAGQAVSIRCDVSYYEGPRDQDFEWSLVLAGDKLLSLVSTFDSNFVDPSMRDRVNSGDINYNKLGDAAIELKFKKVRATDSGVYRCSTPSTDSVISGNYHADVELKVIADTLEASYSGSPSQSLSEGDPLQLECQVSSQTFQHTHLSVTWFLHGEEDEIPRPIITLDKDLTVKPGAGFEDGYRAGLISMDKVEDTTYRLKMPQVQQSDQGKFFCKAIEWIQDPDRSWTQIAHKTTTACNVEIKRIVAPDAGSFSVHLKASKGPLQEGDELDIRCSVNAQNLPGHFFSVTWLKNQQKVAHIGSSGVLTMFDSYKERENAAEMRAVKTSHTDYLLTIRSARAEDQGQYQCEVWQENMNEDGTFKKIQKQMSSPETVSITSQFSQQKKPVRGPKVSLAVRWMFQPRNSTVQTNILSIRHTGEITWRADQRNYQLSIQAQPLDTHFTLMVPRASKQQEGQYQCQVDAYQKDVQKAKIISNPLAVIVQKPGKYSYLFKKIMYVRFILHQKFGHTLMLLTMDLDAVVKFGPAAGLEMDQRIRMEIRQKQDFQLTIHQVRTSDSGQYHCEVEEWLQDPLGDWYSLKKMSVSKELVVKEKESKLHVQKDNRTLNITNHQAGFTVDCVIDSQSSDKSVFEVTWFKVQEEEGPVTMFTARRDGILHSAISYKYLVFGRPLATHYKLTVPQINPTDMGQYYCQVEEWLLTANTWKKLDSDKSGVLSIYVHTEGDSDKQTDPLGTALGVTIPLICFLVLVIILLLRRDHKRNSELKKKKDCLWAENNPLSPMPEVTPAAGDHS